MSDDVEKTVDQEIPDAGGESVAPLKSLEGFEVGKAPKKKRLMPPSRIVFLVFVAVAAVVIVLEGRARLGYSQTVKQLKVSWQEGLDSGDGLFRKDLDEIVHGAPSRKYVEKDRSETFTWKGIRAHTLRVHYTVGDFVESFETTPGG